MPGPAQLELDPAREEAELRAYLGESFDRSLLERYQDTLDAEYASCGDEQAFYRTSEGYLYNLTAFAMTGTKLPYLEELTSRLEPGARVLDYGCGIGADGLLLAEAGYRVEFADFDNPSVTYLRWRLEHRGIDAPVHNLDDHVPGGFDASYAFDVIEHVDDPYSFLGEMESRSEIVAVNLLEPEPDEQDLHHELPIAELRGYFTKRDLVSYQVLHGRSHLVLYRPSPVGPVRRLLNRGRLAAA